VRLQGSAEAVGVLDEDEEEDVVVKAEVDSMATPPKAVLDALPGNAADGLSLFAKLGFLALIVGVCAAYIKMHTPRRTGYAGRHGAYEKGGLP